MIKIGKSDIFEAYRRRIYTTSFNAERELFSCTETSFTTERLRVAEDSWWNGRNSYRLATQDAGPGKRRADGWGQELDIIFATLRFQVIDKNILRLTKQVPQHEW